MSYDVLSATFDPICYNVILSGLPSRILNLYQTKWALAFVCFSFFSFIFFLATCARLS